MRVHAKRFCISAAIRPCIALVRRRDPTRLKRNSALIHVIPRSRFLARGRASAIYTQIYSGRTGNGYRTAIDTIPFPRSARDTFHRAISLLHSSEIARINLDEVRSKGVFNIYSQIRVS